jgi:Raf kinase inhibitor-like YbhB/YbcL family protein
MPFHLSSSAFAPGETIPKRYTCDGADQSPPLTWSDPPAGTQSLSMIVEDPDAPGGTFVHWVIYRLPPSTTELAAGLPRQAELSDGARQGRNSFRRVGYGGPCPPAGTPHHYHFQLFALDTTPEVTSGASASELRSAMNGHIVGQTELIGLYGR